MTLTEETQMLKDLFAEEPTTLLTELGIDWKFKTRLEFLCPFHNDHSEDGCTIYRGKVHCFVCGASADVFQLVEQVTGIKDFDEKKNYVAEIYGVNLSNEKEITSKKGKNLLLSAEERTALDLPVTDIGLSEVRSCNENLYKKIILSNAARQIERYRKLDEAYGARDAEEAYVFGKYTEADEQTFHDIHKLLQRRIDVLQLLQSRF